MLYYNRVFIFARSRCSVFFERKRVMYCLSRPMLSRLLVFIFMKFLILSKSIRERLTIVCEEEPRKLVLVRGHFKVVNGRKVYVKTHYRKR